MIIDKELDREIATLEKLKAKYQHQLDDSMLTDDCKISINQKCGSVNRELRNARKHRTRLKKAAKQ